MLNSSLENWRVVDCIVRSNSAADDASRENYVGSH